MLALPSNLALIIRAWLVLMEILKVVNSRVSSTENHALRHEGLKHDGFQGHYPYGVVVRKTLRTTQTACGRAEQVENIIMQTQGKRPITCLQKRIAHT